MSSQVKGKFRSHQDYKLLRAKCLRSGQLFEDSEFPAVDQSIFFSQKPPRPFVWKRPAEICDNPSLFVGGASRFDIAQGELGDCWFLAAVASLSLHQSLLYKVVPPDQSFQDGYAGIFRFHFWYYGDWVEVVVDDLLPTYNNRLVFLHSTENNEFWSALLEKAYAKMVGSYEALKGGSQMEAMEDFTGGVGEMYELREKAPKNLVRIMMTAMQRMSLLGCSINAKPGVTEAKQDNGLIMGHAYSITGVKKVTVPTSRGNADITLVRIRNPWGQVEWNGAWSDDSGNWKYIPDAMRRELGLVNSDDGEFWMDYHDFIREFQRVEICNLSPDELTEEISSSNAKKWVASHQDGHWRRGSTAGGCRNFPETFWINPQFQMSLEEIDDPEDDDDDDEEGCSVIIALLQKFRRRQKKLGKEFLTIGFAIYKVEKPGDEPLPKDFFLYHASSARSNSFINSREISGRFKLPQGHYVIVPSTFEAGEDGDFLVRIFSFKQSTAGGLDETTGMVEVPPEPEKPPEQVAEESAMETRFREFFSKLTGDDMEVDAWELREILNSALRKDLGGGEGFSLESCKSMVALYDDDMSGKLGFEEFKELWMDIRKWKGVFAKYDADRSGHFNTFELRMALRSVGFKLSTKAFSSMALRYGDKNQHIDLDDFVQCSIKLKHMFNSFAKYNRGGQAVIGLDDFIQNGMYS